jgi:mannose-1-phosphate guanylyltransferase
MSSQEIFAVILAGGSGTRFWPASRRLRPKQLLPLGPSAPQSLIAATVDRLRGLVDEEHVLISTGAHLVEQTQKELPGLKPVAYLAEPQAKNTAPCIAWAAAAIARKNPDAIVCVLPSDQHAQDAAGFVTTLKEAARSAATGSITTIGIVPTRPETGYGYIEKGESLSDSSFRVRRFEEKPDLPKAEQFCASGNYLWNAGIFVFRARDMLSAVEQHLPKVHGALGRLQAAWDSAEVSDEEAVAAFFESCDSISIDYGVMEKRSDLSVVPGDFGWSDLGSWESAWELSERDQQGNAAPLGTILVDAKNNLVEDLTTQTSKKVIALVGVEDLCVVETDDALLVMPRSQSQEVRTVVERLKESKRDNLI